MYLINIPLALRIPQHHAAPQPPKQTRQSQVNLRIRQLHARALAGSLAEIAQILEHALPLFRLGVHPALGIERARIWENGLVLVEEPRRHADGRVGRDDPLPKGERGMGLHTREAVHGAVTQTQTLVDNGGEVGERLEGLQTSGSGGTGDGSLELRE